MPAPKRNLSSNPKAQRKLRPRTTPSLPKSQGQGVIGSVGEGVVVAERLGDDRFAAAQKQTLVVQTGHLVGNRSLLRMLHGLGHQGTPHIQRSPGLLGAMLVGNVLAVKAAVQPTITQHEALSDIDQAIDKLGSESRKKSYYHEEIGKGRDELVEGIGTLRGRVAETVIAEKLGLEEGLANAIRQHFHLKISRLAPFYTQTANANILATKTTKAAMRTCNITTVAMTLEGLGKTVTDFQGNSGLMNHITGRLDLGTSEASSLRLPDFLQILAIYLEMVKKQNASSLNTLATANPEQFQTVMGESAMDASNNILRSDLFGTFTKQFGISAQSHTLDLNPALAVFGAYYRPFEGDLEDYVRDKKNKKKNANVSEAEKDEFREEFTEKRKAGYRKKAERLGKSITTTGEAVQEIEAEITAAKNKITTYDDQLKTFDEGLKGLDAEMTRLNGEIAAADKAAQKTLKEQLKTVKADHKAKTKERKGTAKKKDKLQKNLTKLEKEKGKKLAEQAGLRLEQGASEAVGSETNEAAEVEGALPLATYQNAVLPLMLELLGSGKQVIINLHNHFVKLQEITTDTIIVHDPGGFTRDNMAVSWEDARKLGYFKRYTVVG